MNKSVCIALGAASGLFAAGEACAEQDQQASLAGTWSLVAADKELPDGAVVSDYGAAPTGRLMIDEDGRYALQIFKSERTAFAGGVKTQGTDAEMRMAVTGSSTHYGVVEANWEAATLTFSIEDSSFPNWRGAVQVRSFRLEGDELRYKVPPRADGSVPISVWRRVGGGE